MRYNVLPILEVIHVQSQDFPIDFIFKSLVFLQITSPTRLLGSYFIPDAIEVLWYAQLDRHFNNGARD
jgi:hypothetical protein